MKKVYVLSTLIALSLSSCQIQGESFSSSQNEREDMIVTNLEIASLPLKTTYYEGEKFNRSGLKLKATFQDGKTYTPLDQEITISTKESLNLLDREVTATYLNQSVVIPILVKSLELDYVAIASYPITSTYVQGGNYAFIGLSVKGKVKDGDERPLSESDFSLSIEGKEVHDQDVITLTAGNYDVEVITHCGQITSFPIKIVKGYKMEAENILFEPLNSPPTSYVRVKNNVSESYLTQSNASGMIRAISDSTALLASGTSYLGDIKNGNVIDFYFYAEKSQDAEISLRAASGFLSDGNGWDPIEMSSEQVSLLFDASFNGEGIAIDDDIILPGKKSENGEVDVSLWVNWNVVNFSTLTTCEGWNVISLTVTSEYINYLGYDCSFNLDYLSVNFIS